MDWVAQYIGTPYLDGALWMPGGNGIYNIQLFVHFEHILFERI